MLNATDNEILTRVGPGTLMGNLLRRYWIPALLSMEVPVPDSPPVRVRILCEDLVAFRDTNGDVGLFTQACPHRGASMFFGRNEEGGLRCVYHGWKFDKTGACVDMPSEPAESNFKNKVRTTAYPTHEWNGYVWAYMGPPETMKSFREPAPSIPREMWPTARVLSECNWVQALEGNIDTSHISYLHRNLEHFSLAPDETDRPGVPSNEMSTFIRAYDRAPSVEVQETWYGFRYAGIRQTPAGYKHVRMTEFIMPFTTRVATIPVSSTVSFGSMVPIDDYNCWRGTANGGLRGAAAGGDGVVPKGGIAPRTQNQANDFLIDREKQRNFSYTGILGINQQDMAVTESMGAIYDRGHEHLGTTDRAIITLRKMLIKAARDLANGIEPPTADMSLPLEQIRSAERIILPTDDWRLLGTEADPVVSQTQIAAAPMPLS
ncbi:MAG TPA: Rieske 2Fe-2S domain-containing protein [Dehalococcoidia bacterium]|nr:Rieske 2Fe-2S domain-containing protein [Dehalococcoidia bacterium]